MRVSTSFFMASPCEAKLGCINPAFAGQIRAAAEKLAAAGTAIQVASGLRTASEQDALYAQGRTAPGHIVTNARAGYSMHNFGLAADIVPYLSGHTGCLNWDSNTPQFRAMVAALEKQGLIWGGSWKSIPDFDHFQMPDLPVTPTSAMRADYAGGTPEALQRIWAKAARGEYHP